jgi:hypothetical protein
MRLLGLLMGLLGLTPKGGRRGCITDPMVTSHQLPHSCSRPVPLCISVFRHPPHALQLVDLCQGGAVAFETFERIHQLTGLSRNHETIRFSFHCRLLPPPLIPPSSLLVSSFPSSRHLVPEHRNYVDRCLQIVRNPQALASGQPVQEMGPLKVKERRGRETASYKESPSYQEPATEERKERARERGEKERQRQRQEEKLAERPDMFSQRGGGGRCLY